MITHVVLLQPKASSTDEEISAVLRQVVALREVIPGLTAIAVGKNRSSYHRGYTLGIIMHFIDEVHLEAHHPHPAHVAVVEALDRICESTIDFDLPEADMKPPAESLHW
ncbi:MAG: hypothetical protein NVSMB27_11910 [Ktedonobacteraceae bacterium]